MQGATRIAGGELETDFCYMLFMLKVTLFGRLKWYEIHVTTFLTAIYVFISGLCPRAVASFPCSISSTLQWLGFECWLTAVEVIDAGTDNFEYSLFLNQSMCWINLLVNQETVVGNMQIQ